MALSDVYMMLDRFGADMQIKRLPVPGPEKTSTARMVRSDAGSDTPVVGDVSQFATRFFVRHGALVEAGFPVPPKRGDKVISDGETYTLRSVVFLNDCCGRVKGYKLLAQGH